MQEWWVCMCEVKCLGWGRRFIGFYKNKKNLESKKEEVNLYSGD